MWLAPTRTRLLAQIIAIITGMLVLFLLDNVVEIHVVVAGFISAIVAGGVCYALWPHRLRAERQ